MPRAHAGAVGQMLHVQWGMEVLAHPGQQRTETAIRRLQLQQGRELRLAAAASVVHDKLPRSVLRHCVTMILSDHRQRQVDPGRDAG